MTKGQQSGFFLRYWLAFAIAGTVVFAWLFPGPALALPRLHVLDIGVVVIMFIGSLKLAPSRFREAVKRIDLIGVSVVSVFFLAPLLSLAAATLFGFTSEPDKLSVLICSAQASTLATGIVLTEIAGGAVALAMVITMANNMVTVFLTPLVFRLFSDASIQVDHLAMGQEIAFKIVLPVLVAQVARHWLAGFAARRSRVLSITSQLIILLYIYAGVAAGLARLGGPALLLPRILGLVVVFHLTLVTINALIARLLARDSGERTAFVLCSSQKTLPAAMIIWKGYFPGLPLGPIVAVAYHLTQLVVDSIVAPGFKRLPLIRTRRIDDDRRGGGHNESKN
jgi:sodium/bile acid cotransporter 7